MNFFKKNNISTSDITNTLQGAGGLASTLTTAMANDTTKVPKADLVATSKSDLLAQLNDFNGISLGRESGGGVGDVMSGVMGGASAGSAAGPWGALIGAAVGGISSGVLGGWGRRKRNAQRAAKEADYNTQIAEQAMAMNDQLNEQATSNIMANYKAYGGEFSTGLTSFNNGGTHELNINGGILQGFDSQGVPNLVEEGETKWNNYIFSNRLKLDKQLTKDYHLPKNVATKSFAQASEIINKGAKERPNDPISIRGLKSNMNRLQQAQELIKQYEQLATEYINSKKDGGSINIDPSKKGSFTREAKKRNLSTQEFASKVLNNKEKYSTAMIKKANFAKNAANWNAEGGPILIGRNTKNRFNNQNNILNPFAFGGGIDNTHYNKAVLQRGGQGANVYLEGGPYENAMYAPVQTFLDQNLPTVKGYTPRVSNLNISSETSSPEPAIKREFQAPILSDNLTFKDSSLKYLDQEMSNLQTQIKDNPFVGNLAQVQSAKGAQDRKGFFNNLGTELGMMAPTIANIATAIKASRESPEQFNFPKIHMDTNNFLNTEFPYKPIDREYIANKIRSQAGATKRGIINTSGGNRATAQASLLAADRNFLNALGDAYFKADDINYNRFMDARTRSNQAKAMNSQLEFKPKAYNAQIAQQELLTNAQNRAAAQNIRRDAGLQIGASLGELARYKNNSDIIKQMYLYDKRGNYLKK